MLLPPGSFWHGRHARQSRPGIKQDQPLYDKACSMGHGAGPGGREKSCHCLRYETGSKNFAEEAARVLAEAGLKVLIFDRYSPVPLLSYTVRELHCDGGIVITASHNTKAYNGFKTYEASGAQMGPNKTEEIFRWMLKKADPLDVPHCDDLTQENIEWIGEEIAERFTSAAADCSKLNDSSAKKDLSIVYTAALWIGS